MSARRLRAAAFLAVAGLATGALAVNSAAATPELPAAVQSLQTCVQSSHRLLVLNLIDESGSLQHTDPNNERVPAVKALLAGLARLGSSKVAGQPIDVEVRTATFSGGYRSEWPDGTAAWLPANEKSLPELLTDAGALTARNKGRNTDYVTALTNAEADLVDRSAELTAAGGDPPCMALVWFTDGQYDLEPARNGQTATVPYAPGVTITTKEAAAHAMDLGRQAMCASGTGLVDRLRSNDVKIFAIGLHADQDSGALDFLKSVSSGSAAVPCGSNGTPESGVYLPASDGEQLLFLFSSLFDTPAAVQNCPDAGRSDCRFDTVPGLSGFTLLISMPAAGDTVTLRGPDGSIVDFQANGSKSAAVAGAQLAAQWFSDQAVRVDGAFPDADGAWVGTWAMSFRAGNGGSTDGSGSYTVRLRADLYPAVLGTSTVKVGSASRLTLGLINAAGHLVSSSPLLNGASLQAALVDVERGSSTPVTVTPSGVGEWTTTVTPKAGDDRVPHLALDLNALLSPTKGVKLRTGRRRVSLTVVPPPSFPSIRPTSLDLPSVRGRGSTKSTVTVTGPTQGSGCVWVDSSRVSLPQAADAATISVAPNVTGRQRCLHIGAGQTKKLTVEARVGVDGSGRAGGAIPFNLQGTTDKVLHTRVQVSFDMRPAPNAGRAVALFVGLLLAGILLPLGLLALLNLWGARFAAPALLAYLARDVEVTDMGLSPIGTDRILPGGLDPDGYRLVANEAELRAKSSFQVDRFSFDTRAFGRRGERRWSLFEGPYGVVSTASRLAVADAQSGSLRAFLSAGTHQVPLSLAGTWIFDPERRDPEPDDVTSPATSGDGSAPVRGRLLLLLPSYRTEQADSLLASAQQRLIALHSDLKEVVASEPPDEQPSILSRLRRVLRRDDGPPADVPDPDDVDIYST